MCFTKDKLIKWTFNCINTDIDTHNDANNLIGISINSKINLLNYRYKPFPDFDRIIVSKVL